MMGRPDAPELKGLIPRSLEQIFQISQSLKDQGWKYKMQVYMLHYFHEFTYISENFDKFCKIFVGFNTGNIQ